MSYFIYALRFFILFYITLLAVLYALQRKFIYFPHKAPPSLDSLSGIYTEAQTQTKDHLTLTHWHARRGQTHIVVLHGNAGNIEHRAYKFQFLADQGYSVLLIGYRGYGGNPGRPTEQNLISDSALALEWLFQKEGLSSKEVILFGESLGSAVAIALAAQYPVKGLIFDGAFSSLTEIGQSIYPFLPIRYLLKDKWDSKTRIQKVKSPLLFIHSKRDSVVPFRLAESLFQAGHPPKRHIWLEDSGHNDNLESESVRPAIIDFIQKL